MTGTIWPAVPGSRSVKPARDSHLRGPAPARNLPRDGPLGPAAYTPCGGEVAMWRSWKSLLALVGFAVAVASCEPGGSGPAPLTAPSAPSASAGDGTYTRAEGSL